jgi:hypothetical protein
MDTAITTTTLTENPVRTYFSRVNRALLSPTRFFQDDYPALTLSEALTFGILSAWLASAIAFAFETLNSFVLSRLFERWVQRLFATEDGFSVLNMTGNSFLFTAGFLLLGPFFYLLRIILGASVVYSFSLLLVEKSDLAAEPVTFKGALKIQATAFAGHWFAVVPIFGSFVAFVANLVLLVTGIRERFRVSTRRASVIVLAPYFVLFLTLLLLSVVMAVAMMQFPFEELLNIDPEQLGL